VTAQEPQLEHLVEIFKFYEDAAREAKNQAWTQTSWILTINAAILGFTLDLFIEHRSAKDFALIEWISAIAGIILCVYALIVLTELGNHIQTYWTLANKTAVQHPFLIRYIGPTDAENAGKKNYRALFPPFIKRLMIAPVLFAVAHFGWVLYATLSI
jgi:Ca2+/H+ antiporter